MGLGFRDGFYIRRPGLSFLQKLVGFGLNIRTFATKQDLPYISFIGFWM